MPFNMHFVLYLICTEKARREQPTRSQVKLQFLARLGPNVLLGIRTYIVD